MKILLVIKDRTLLDVIAATLEHSFGHYVFRTLESEKAFQLITRIDTDMLIASLNMDPEGAEPIVLAARARNPNLPVLLIAGSFGPDDLSKVTRLRAACWQTGGSIADLVDAIERARDIFTPPVDAS